MLNSSYLKYIPDPLLEDIVSSRCIPIIGAGFSRNAISLNGPLSLWNDLGAKFTKLMPDYDYINPIDSISAFTYLNGKTRLAEYLSQFLNVDEVQPGRSHISFAELYFQKIITTNFDFLLEEALRQQNINFRIVMDESQLPMSSVNSEKLILKIHGDIHHPQRIVATEEDYDKFILHYPVLSTYISNLLISKTALFIGYSLDDPDFRQLFQILKNRLGQLQRPAYVILVSPKPAELLRYERRGVQVVSIPGEPSQYDIILSTLFSEIKSHWDRSHEERITIINEKSESTLSLPKGSKSMMCFVSIPLKMLTYYRSYIYPLLEKFGFNPVNALDVKTTDENFFAKISNLIQRAELVIAEPTTENIIYEVMSAIKLESGNNKNIIIVKEEGQPLTALFKDLLCFERPKFPLIPDEQFIESFEASLKKLSAKLGQSLELEPERLLNKNEYRAAVISSFVLLESELRELAYCISNQKRPIPLSKIIDSLVIEELLQVEEINTLKKWMNVRNLLIHTNKSIESFEAKEIVNGILGFIKIIKNRENNNK